MFSIYNIIFDACEEKYDIDVRKKLQKRKINGTKGEKGEYFYGKHIILRIFLRKKYISGNFFYEKKYYSLKEEDRIVFFKYIPLSINEKIYIYCRVDRSNEDY